MGWSPSAGVAMPGELDLNASAVGEPGMETSEGVGFGNGVDEEEGVLPVEKRSSIEDDSRESKTIGVSGNNGVNGKRVVDLERVLGDEDLVEDAGDRVVEGNMDAEVGKSESGDMPRIEEESDDKTEIVVKMRSTMETTAEETVMYDDQVEDVITKAKDQMEDAAIGAGLDGDWKAPIDEQEQSETTRKRGRRKRASWKWGTSSFHDCEYPRYNWSSGEDKAGFCVPDLVWGKVRSHPWWPGQIFDPSDASELALKHYRKDNHLVAYFVDKTFAWCDESQMKPFLSHFRQMEKQSNLDVFVNAVDCILEEVSRRTELGMTCHCIPEEAYYSLKYQNVDNAGIREGTFSAAADRFLNASSFQPDRLAEYIEMLARFPYSGTDSLDLVIAKAQLKAFYQSKGYPELPQFIFGGTLGESDAEILPSQAEKSEEDESNLTLSDMISGKRKLKAKGSLLRKRKHVVEEGRKKKSLSELMEVKLDDDIKSLSRGKAYGKSEPATFGKKLKALNTDSTGPGRSKKKRLDALGDLETKILSPTSTRPLKVGERIRRIASQMTDSPSIMELKDGKSKKGEGKGDKRKGNTMGSDALPHALVRSKRNKRSIARDHSSPSEMLSLLCLVARDPLKEYGFEPAIVGFFTGVRELMSSWTLDGKNHVGQNGRKRGRKRSANTKPSPSDASDSEYKQDSYWSDIIFEDSSEILIQSNFHKMEGDSLAQLLEKTKKKKKKKKKKMVEPVEEVPLVNPPRPVLDTKQLQDGPTNPAVKQDLSVERSICSFGGNPVEECSPTTLILSFTESDALPSESDLIRIFGHYGPLDEAETEVVKKNNRAKVVFKRRADAEIAFSSAGKFSIFGPALVSYRLRYSTSKPKALPNSALKTNNETSMGEVGNPDIPGLEVPVMSDNTQIPAQEVTVLSNDARVEVTAKGSSE